MARLLLTLASLAPFALTSLEIYLDHSKAFIFCIQVFQAILCQEFVMFLAYSMKDFSNSTQL